jgi:ATP-binding cassette subfamily C protein
MVLSLDAFRLLTRFFQRTNRAELIGMLLVLGTGFFLVRADLTTVGAVTAAALYFHRLFNPIGALLTVFDLLRSAGASLARLAGVAGTATQPEPRPGRRSPPELVLSGVSHEYRPGTAVLHDVSLRLAPGETAAWVTQEVHVFAATVRDNLGLGAPGASDAAVRAALQATRAWPWVAALPRGWDTVVGHGGHALTPAQAQQLALARVLLLDPPLVVLDEATAEAGSSGARELDIAARAVTSGRTALVVAHRLTQAGTADRVVVLHDGRVVEEGTHAALLESGGGFAELWRSWTGDR